MYLKSEEVEVLKKLVRTAQLKGICRKETFILANSIKKNDEKLQKQQEKVADMLEVIS